MNAAHPSIRLIAVAILALGGCQVWGEPGSDKRENSQGPILMPGGIASPNGKIGFVNSLDGKVEALELEPGKLLWTTSVPCSPLLATDSRVIVQVPEKGKSNIVRIRVLDSKDKGKQMLESEAVTFPDWVATGLAYGRSFNSAARIDKGDLLLKWEAHAFYAGGAAPPPGLMERSKKDAQGVAKVNLETGKIDMLSEAKDAGEPRLPAEVEKVKSLQYWTGSRWDTRPLVVNGKAAALFTSNGANGMQTLSLKTWDLSSGKANASVELLQGKSLWVHVTPHNSFVCVHQALAKNQLPEGDYAWWIFSLETGERVAKVPFEEGTQTVAVIGPRLLYAVNQRQKGPFETPRTLKAVDLNTGKLLWERPIEGLKRLPPRP